ncbi:MAG: MFS transporter, partial [Hasllibacter sp.]
MTSATTDMPAAVGDRRRIFGWLMFDWASQPFYTLCLTFIFGPYFTAVVAEAVLSTGVGERAADARAQVIWSRAQTWIGVAIALTAPFLGALADTSGRKMPWIWAFSALYVIGTAGLWVMVPDASMTLLALVAFGIAMVGAEFTTIFTNAMLPSLATGGRIGRLSGAGYALGYAGGVLSLLIMLALFAESPAGTTLLGTAPAFGLDPAAREGTRFVGPFAALWFALFMVPFFLYV